jgi:hypothetical protein
MSERPSDDDGTSTQLTTKRRVLWGSLFILLALFWGAGAVLPGSIPTRAALGLVGLAFAYSAWRAIVRGQLDDDDDDDDPGSLPRNILGG